MEFGFLFYFFIVFGCGGLLLLGSIVYLLREFLVRGDRPDWPARSGKSKTVFLTSILLVVGLSYVPLHMVWVTRLEAIPGRYAADGAWGNAVLEIQRDGSFVETWHLKNEYNGKAEGDGSTRGRWNDKRRDWLTRDIVLDPFKGLAQYDRGSVAGARPAIVMGYGGATSIDVDSGANITFFK